MDPYYSKVRASERLAAFMFVLWAVVYAVLLVAIIRWNVS